MIKSKLHSFIEIKPNAWCCAICGASDADTFQCPGYSLSVREIGKYRKQTIDTNINQAEMDEFIDKLFSHNFG